jgi:hypothetical protein
MIEMDTTYLLKLVLLPLSKTHKAVVIQMSDSTPIDENGVTAINCIYDKILRFEKSASAYRYFRKSCQFFFFEPMQQ